MNFSQQTALFLILLVIPLLSAINAVVLLPKVNALPKDMPNLAPTNSDKLITIAKLQDIPANATQYTELPRLAINPNNDIVYVSPPSGKTIWKVNASSSQILEKINVDNPFGFVRSIAVNPATNTTYVLSGPNFFAIREKQQLEKSSATPVLTKNITDVAHGIKLYMGYDIAIDPKTNLIYVVRNQMAFWLGLIVIDGTSERVVANKTLGQAEIISTDKVAVSPDSSEIYLNPPLAVYDNSSLQIKNEIIGVGGDTEPVVNRELSKIYIGDSFSRSVAVIDIAKNYTVIDHIPLAENSSLKQVSPHYPMAIATDLHRDIVYATDSFSSSVVVVDGRSDKILERISLNSTGSLNIAVNSDTGIVYATDGYNLYALNQSGLIS